MDIRSSAQSVPGKFLMRLTVRERILTAFVLIGLILIPTTMPQASVDAQQFNPSDPRLQSVERAEDNFAGSAFYFIDPNYAIPQNYGGIGIDPLSDPGTGSIHGLPDILASDGDRASTAHLIRPTAFRGSAVDDSRALHCLTQAIYYEAGMEPDAGQRGVAQVILNRVRHPSYPGTVCGVIYQGSERKTGCQFSYTCDGSLRRKAARFHWDRAKKVAAEALAGKSYSSVGTATHYHATYVYPYWAPSLRFLGTVGAHRFYSWKGNAGKASAFQQRYRGGEPLPAVRLPTPIQTAARRSTLLHWKRLMKPADARPKPKQPIPRKRRLWLLTMPVGMIGLFPLSMSMRRESIRRPITAGKPKPKVATAPSLDRSFRTSARSSLNSATAAAGRTSLEASGGRPATQ